MNVDVLISAGEVSSSRVIKRTVAVIDVFRATSVIVNALQNGAKSVIPVVTVEDALNMREKFAHEKVILGGERNTELIRGFDKDNSPLAYTREDVEGAVIIFTTTNGTRAIYNSRSASTICVASFLNMSAVCRYMVLQGRDITLVCSGREDNFTTEDGLCAGAMVKYLVESFDCSTTDMAQVMMNMYDRAKDDLKGRLASTDHYKYMLTRGYDDDIDFCLRHDIFDIVPSYSIKGDVTLLNL